MQAEDKRDLLFALVAVEGFVNLMCAWALLLLATHGSKLSEFVGPGIAFATTSVLLLATSAGADHVRRAALPSPSAPAGQRRPR
jgi:hypothetical protein